MKTFFSALCFACFSTGLTCALASETVTEPRYRFVDLGTLGGAGSRAWDVNARGQVVGWARVENNDAHAAIWEGGQWRNLGTLGGANSQLMGINEQGLAVGYAETGEVNANGTASHPGVLFDGIRIRSIGTFNPNARQAIPLAINSREQVVGYTWNYPFGGYPQPYLWQDGVATPLPNPLTDQAEVNAINNRGVSVGAVSNGVWHAVMWDESGLVDLGALPGGNYAQAWGIDDSNNVVGYSWTDSPATHAFLYRNGIMRDVGSLIGAEGDSRLYDINNAGDAVGISSYSEDASGAALYSGGVWYDLHQLSDVPSQWRLLEARAISESGLIVGEAWFESSRAEDIVYSRGYLLVPEERPAITRFTLIDAKRDKALGTLAPQGLIDLSRTGDALNIRVDATSPIKSVLFSLNGSHVNIENTRPFAFARNNGSDYFVWRPERGRHTLVARGYTEKNLQGQVGINHVSEFEVVAAYIEAEDYDTGGPGISYVDTTPGNSGGEYRTDDVDIERAWGDIDGDYNVGWMQDGEYLVYTLGDIAEGDYTIDVRVASLRDYPGKLRLFYGDRWLGDIDVQPTGGWQVWETRSLPDVWLPKSRNTPLRMEVLDGRFNVNWIKIK